MSKKLLRLVVLKQFWGKTFCGWQFWNIFL